MDYFPLILTVCDPHAMALFMQYPQTNTAGQGQ